MAAALPSAFDTNARCTSCQTLLNSGLRCPKCGSLRKLPEQEVCFFSLFGLTTKLAIDLSQLRERFYGLSRDSHPDRFLGSEQSQRDAAAKWSALVNKAHATLRDESQRADYLLSRHFPAEEVAATSRPPLELAEAYFELQEAREAGEDTSDLAANLKSEILKQVEGQNQEWLELAEAPADKQGIEWLRKLQLWRNKKRYLVSLLNDIERRQRV